MKCGNGIWKRKILKDRRIEKHTIVSTFCFSNDPELYTRQMHRRQHIYKVARKDKLLGIHELYEEFCHEGKNLNPNINCYDLQEQDLQLKKTHDV